jgi:hypothetical protein
MLIPPMAPADPTVVERVISRQRANVRPSSAFEKARRRRLRPLWRVWPPPGPGKAASEAPTPPSEAAELVRAG